VRFIKRVRCAQARSLRSRRFSCTTRRMVYGVVTSMYFGSQAYVLLQFPITALREIKLLKMLSHVNILTLEEMAVERSKGTFTAILRLP